MQRSAFIIALFSLFAFLSLALASPLPVQAIKEMRENVIELSARDVPVDHEILHREVSADTESDTDLHVLAREHDTYGGSVPGSASEKDVARDIQDVERRVCRYRQCV